MAERQRDIAASGSPDSRPSGKIGLLSQQAKVSVGNPLNRSTYLGLLVDSAQMKLLLTNEKAQGIMEDCRQVLAKRYHHSPRTSVCDWKNVGCTLGSPASTPLHPPPAISTDTNPEEVHPHSRPWWHWIVCKHNKKF